MKYFVTLFVCALLTVGLIVAVEAVNVETPPELAVSLLVAIMMLPLLLLGATLWALIGVMKTVANWSLQDLCPECRGEKGWQEPDGNVHICEECGGKGTIYVHDEAKWKKKNLCPRCKCMWANCKCK
jgi:hypothetical protein